MSRAPSPLGSRPCNARSPRCSPTLGGGGVAAVPTTYLGSVAVFAVDVRHVGLTASNNGTQDLTAWHAAGVMIGQVTGTASGDSTFIGLAANQPIHFLVSRRESACQIALCRSRRPRRAVGERKIAALTVEDCR